MDMSCRSAWHAGGTCTPFIVKRGGPPRGIRHRCATDVVPLRATERGRVGLKCLMRSASQAPGAPNGMEWHDRPCESTQGRRRAQ